MVKLRIETDGIILDQLELSSSVWLIIQKRTFANKTWIDLRKYIITKKFTGFSKKGLAIEPEFVKPLAKKLLKLKLKLK